MAFVVEQRISTPDHLEAKIGRRMVQRIKLHVHPPRFAATQCRPATGSHSFLLTGIRATPVCFIHKRSGAAADTAAPVVLSVSQNYETFFRRRSGMTFPSAAND